MTSSWFGIYFLRHPTSKEVRYVGMTSRPLDKRYAEHIYDGNHRPHTYKDNWIKSLLKQNLLPEIELVEEYDTLDCAVESEIFYISYLISLGVKLTNLTDGGEGITGWHPSPEQRKKLSIIQQNKVLPPESLASLKKKLSKHNKGKILEQETCDKIRDSKIGDKNPNFGKFIPKRKITFEQACEIRRLDSTGDFTYTDLANMFDLNLSSTINIIKNKTYLTPNVNNHRRKLTFEQAQEIRKLNFNGTHSKRELAEKYGVDQYAIYQIIRNKSYLV